MARTNSRESALRCAGARKSPEELPSCQFCTAQQNLALNTWMPRRDTPDRCSITPQGFCSFAVQAYPHQSLWSLAAVAKSSVAARRAAAAAITNAAKRNMDQRIFGEGGVRTGPAGRKLQQAASWCRWTACGPSPHNPGRHPSLPPYSTPLHPPAPACSRDGQLLRPADPAGHPPARQGAHHVGAQGVQPPRAQHAAAVGAGRAGGRLPAGGCALRHCSELARFLPWAWQPRLHPACNSMVVVIVTRLLELRPPLCLCTAPQQRGDACHELPEHRAAAGAWARRGCAGRGAAARAGDGGGDSGHHRRDGLAAEAQKGAQGGQQCRWEGRGRRALARRGLAPRAPCRPAPLGVVLRCVRSAPCPASPGHLCGLRRGALHLPGQAQGRPAQGQPHDGGGGWGGGTTVLLVRPGAPGASRMFEAAAAHGRRAVLLTVACCAVCRALLVLQPGRGISTLSPSCIAHTLPPGCGPLQEWSTACLQATRQRGGATSTCGEHPVWNGLQTPDRPQPGMQGLVVYYPEGPHRPLAQSLSVLH